MKKKGYYSIGQFSELAQVTLRTIRYYDQKDLLKPSFVNDFGARFYTDEDLVKLQQILLLKYLGFTLKEIKSLIVDDTDSTLLLSSLNIQKKLIKNRIEQMQMVEQAIEETVCAIHDEKQVNWNQIVNLIHLTKDESNLKKQYQDASNLTSRIDLHNKYSINKKGWFPWIFEKVPFKKGANILEIGCGDGSFWIQNAQSILEDVNILLSDLSEGMIRDARRQIQLPQFSFQSFDCSCIPLKNHCYDVVIANHVLFYCEDIEKVLTEIKRVLKPNGVLICSTYGVNHMKEITELVSNFDERVNLSSMPLSKRFGKENGKEILSKFFSQIEWEEYEDYLLVDDKDALISYILSCHGNQNDYLLSNFKAFNDFVQNKVGENIKITKEAGIFIAKI